MARSTNKMSPQEQEAVDVSQKGQPPIGHPACEGGPLFVSRMTAPDVTPGAWRSKTVDLCHATSVWPPGSPKKPQPHSSLLRKVDVI